MISSGVPLAISFPVSSKPNPSDKNSASSKCYVVSKIHLCFLRSFISYQICSLTKGSSPVVGSSIIITLLLPHTLIAMESLLFKPPLRFFANVFLNLFNAVMSNISSMLT